VPIWSYIIVAVAAYLLGSIPTGYLVAKAKGIDIRTVGSGNIGATNTFRILGKPAGIFVLIADAVKGWLACAFAAVFLAVFLTVTGLRSPSDPDVREMGERFTLLAGIFAVLGHNYTCWLKFKGGKGIATTAGVYLALAPAPFGIALAVFIVMLLATRYVSVASISAAVALPVAVWFMNPNMPLRIVTIALGALAVYKHRSNIKRLLNGTESRLGKKTSTEETK